MNITLISPYSDLESFGIRTISASLKQEGHNVTLVFLPKQFMERYENNTLTELVNLSKKSSLIGISLMTNYFDNAVQITQRLKDACDIPIIWGGVHPTIRPEECLNYADMVCIGEGEETLVELSGKMDKGQDYYNIRGVHFKVKEKIITNPTRPLTESLDDIQFPDYDCRNHFILNDGSIQKMDTRSLNSYLDGTYMTIPTRGCPFGCTYCCNNTLNAMYPNQKPLRKRSIDNIIKELVAIKKLLPFINRIKFDDDAFFTLSVNEIKEFSEKYKKDIGLQLMITGATPSTLTREKLSLLIDAGLLFIRMGIQTGSENTKKLYNRKHTNQQVAKAVKIINEFKDRIKNPQYDIILDNPWETEKDSIETLMFLSKLPTPYTLSCFSLNLYPATDLYIKAKTDGIITDDLTDIYRKNFYESNKNYLNSLFLLLNDYTSIGARISPKIMRLLTSQKMRQLNLHWLLYILLKILISPFKVKRLAVEGLKDIQKGNWSRIRRYIRNFF